MEKEALLVVCETLDALGDRYGIFAFSGEGAEDVCVLPPNDVDLYEGRYGVEDTRQAIAEARRQGVAVFCLTVDREAPRYAVRVFGRVGFAVLRRPDQLPAVLIDALRQLLKN